MATKANDNRNPPVSGEGENIEAQGMVTTTATAGTANNNNATRQVVYKKIAQYSLIKEIGQGSFARVYKGRSETNGVVEEFAIKMITKQNLREENQELIDKEINILLKLNHPNIIKLKDFKKTTNNWYLIFEFCEEGDMEHYMKEKLKGCFPLHITLMFIQQLASAFKEIRRLKIVHRDLKLANILLNKDLVVKLGDFGFAKHFEDNSLLQSYCGTPITMAPEILKREKYNEKCDIWSLGVIFYQLVYGVAPFQPPKRASVSDLIYLIDNQPVKFEGAFITPGIKDLIARMLVPNSSQRMTFEEFFNHQVVQQDYLQYLPQELQGPTLQNPKEGSNLKPENKLETIPNQDEQQKQAHPKECKTEELNPKVKEEQNLKQINPSSTAAASTISQSSNSSSEEGMLEIKEKQNWALEYIHQRLHTILEEEAEQFQKKVNEYREIAEQLSKDKNTEFGESCAWSALLLLLFQTVKSIEGIVEIHLIFKNGSETFGVSLPQAIQLKLKELSKQLNDQIHSISSFNMELSKQCDACTMLFGNLLHYADYYLLNEFLNSPQIQIKYYNRCMKFCELLQSLRFSVFSTIQISLSNQSIGISKQDIQKILQIPPLAERMESVSSKPKRKMSTLKQLVEIDQISRKSALVDTLTLQDKQEDIQTQYDIYRERYEACLAQMPNKQKE